MKVIFWMYHSGGEQEIAAWLNFEPILLNESYDPIFIKVFADQLLREKSLHAASIMYWF